MEAQSWLRRCTWRPQALLGAQLGSPKRCKMPTWRPKASLRAQLGGPMASEDLLASEKPSKTMTFHWFFYVFHTISKVNLGLYLEGLGRLLGSTWAQLGLNLGALGANLGETWALLGPTWTHFGQLGRPRDHLGRSWGQLGRTLGYMALPKLLLGCSWRLLGASGRPQVAVLAVQSGLSNSTRRPKALRGANSGGLEVFQMPSWRRVAFPDSSTWRNQAVEEQSS